VTITTVADKQTHQIIYLGISNFLDKTNDRFELGRSKIPQKQCFHKIPTTFSVRQFFWQKNRNFFIYNKAKFIYFMRKKIIIKCQAQGRVQISSISSLWVENSLDGHHRLLRNLAMLLLLFDSPCRCTSR
jgi:hypothetical protein